MEYELGIKLDQILWEIQELKKQVYLLKQVIEQIDKPEDERINEEEEIIKTGTAQQKIQAQEKYLKKM